MKDVSRLESNPSTLGKYARTRAADPVGGNEPAFTTVGSGSSGGRRGDRVSA
jgi:hypothetical protein